MYNSTEVFICFSYEQYKYFTGSEPGPEKTILFNTYSRCTLFPTLFPKELFTIVAICKSKQFTTYHLEKEYMLIKIKTVKGRFFFPSVGAANCFIQIIDFENIQKHYLRDYI